MGSLADAYLAGDSMVASLFSAPPGAPSAWPLPAPEWDPNLIESIAAYNTFLGVPKSIPQGARAIVTGQQAAIFGGPLYTVYKAMTAIRLAARMAEESGEPVVPIFWLSGDDHDFDEAREVFALSKHDEIVPLRYAPDVEPTNRSLYNVPLDGNLHGLIDKVATISRSSELKDEVYAFLRESANDSDSLCTWSGRILARLFRDTPLVIFAPHIDAARVVAKPIIAQEIERPLESTRLANDGGEAVRELGYEPQVVKAENEINFFLDCDGVRCKVTFDDGVFHMADANLSMSPDEMRACLDRSPERFSPNVVLRPVVQQRLFPCIAYVGGPGEIAYWAQFGGVFRTMGEAMPVVYPRTRIQLTTTKISKIRSKYDLVPEDLSEPLQSLTEHMLRKASATSPAAVALGEYGGAVAAAADVLREKLLKSHVTAADQAALLRKHIDSDLAAIGRTISHSDEQRVETVRHHAERLHAWYAPKGKPQDRVYSIFTFLFEYGWDLVPRITDAIDETDFSLQGFEL